MVEKVIGIVGGTGLYEMDGLKDIREVEVHTPFGPPSDSYIIGKFEGATLVFLSRHGRGHRFMPSEINYRANIYGMKLLGVQWIISVSAVGSMREEIRPGDIVIPDQFFDRTKSRPYTFFGEGIVGHIGFAHPVCPILSNLLYECAKELGARVHFGGVYMCIEGPQFSTKGESLIYRRWGVDVIGMTAIPEAKLAREAEICYATLAMPTDYDCWHEGEEAVSVEMIIATLKKNVETAKSVIKGTVMKIDHERVCECATALKNVIVTDPEHFPPEKKKVLLPLIGKYLQE